LEVEVSIGEEIADGICTFAKTYNSRLTANAFVLDKWVTVAETVSGMIVEKSEVLRYFAYYRSAECGYLVLLEFVLEYDGERGCACYLFHGLGSFL